MFSKHKTACLKLPNARRMKQNKDNQRYNNQRYYTTVTNFITTTEALSVTY